MSAHAQPNVLTFKADGVISKGQAVKAGSDRDHVAKATGATQKIKGLAMNTTSAADDKVEVALPGGGTKGLLGGTVADGDFLTSDASGNLIMTTTTADRIVAMAMEAGVAGDLIAVHVVIAAY